MIKVLEAQQNSSEHPAQVAEKAYIIVKPNHSADWETNKRIIYAIGLLSAIIASGFTLVGAWIILPFAGLEITALGGALYVVCWKQNYRHVLRFEDDTVTIEKGVYYPKKSWQFDRHALKVSIERQNHPLDPPKIFLCGVDEKNQQQLIPVGDFLNQDDTEKFFTALRQKGLSVRNDSRNVHLEL